jgi:hypothetical protein
MEEDGENAPRGRALHADHGVLRRHVLHLHVLGHDVALEELLHLPAQDVVRLHQEVGAPVMDPEVGEGAPLGIDEKGVGAASRLEVRDVVGNQPLKEGGAVPSGEAQLPAAAAVAEAHRLMKGAPLRAHVPEMDRDPPAAFPGENPVSTLRHAASSLAGCRGWI